jgi:hypothetical protein
LSFWSFNISTSFGLKLSNIRKRGLEAISHVVALHLQVETLTRKSQLLEVELERTTKQLKEAISIAGEETAKCKAAKEVIKSLTAQVSLFTPQAFNFVSFYTHI